MPDENNQLLAAQLPRNLLANIAYFLVSVGIGVLLVPYFISTLGVAAYGLIPLAASITGYVAIFVQSLNTVVTRFLTVDLQRGDYALANRTFNTAFVGLSALVLLMVPVVLVVAWFVPTIFDVPAGDEKEAIYLFLGVTIAFLIRTWSGNFTVSLFAYNRLDLLNLINVINIVVQLLLILTFFSFIKPSLALVGLAYSTSAATATVLAFFLSRRINPHLTINRLDFDRSKLFEICTMSWWVIFGYIGALLFSNIDLIVVNKIFGASEAGEYAIALQWSILINTIAGIFAGVLTPVILTYYAKGQSETLIRVSRTSVKLMGLALALPIGLVCGFAPELLTIWIGKEFSYLAPLLIILIAPLSINLCVMPLFSVNVAYNRVKIPGCATLLLGFSNLLLAIVLSLYTGWGYYGVAIAAAIVVTSKHGVFTPWYASKVLGVTVNTFYRPIIPGAIATIIITGSSFAISLLVNMADILHLMIAGSLVTVVYLAILWSLALEGFERSIFLSYLPTSIRKYER